MKKFLCLLVAAVLFCPAALALGCNTVTSDRSSYEITLSYSDDEGLITATCAYTFYNDTQNEITDLKFNLYGNAYREGALYAPVSTANFSKAYYDGQSYGAMTITSVENCAAWTVEGVDQNILCVNLSESIFPEQTVTLTIAYTLQLAKVNHRTGITQNTVNLGNFYPIACVYEGDEGFVECTYTQEGDPFYSVCADYTVHIELPQGFTVAASGTLDQSFEVGERLKQTYTLKNARDFSLVFSKNFSCLTSTVGDVEINYYYYNDESPQTNLAAACESLKYFSETFGNYAYSTLAIVQTGFCYGGMEYPALCMVSDSLDSDSSLYTIVHEVAHQWWYAGVGSDQISNAWQDEGLAEYSALLFFEHNPAYSFTRTGLVGTATKAYRAYFSVYNQLFGKVDTTMNRPLSAYSGEYEYVNIAYNKGLLLFDYLRQSIGDSKFLAALADYYQTYLYRIATPDDLIDCFVQKGGDLIGFFDSFIDGKIIL